MKKIKLLLSVALLFLAGCNMANNAEEPESTTHDLPMTFSEFTDIPIPENSVMIVERTSIFGRENNWVGTISFTVPLNVVTTFDFYMSEMPKFGWTEITSIRGQHSLLNFTRRRRVVLINLDAKGSDETIATLTMSPAPTNISRGMELNKAAGEERRKKLEEAGFAFPADNAPTPASN